LEFRRVLFRSRWPEQDPPGEARADDQAQRQRADGDPLLGFGAQALGRIGFRHDRRLGTLGNGHESWPYQSYHVRRKPLPDGVITSFAAHRVSDDKNREGSILAPSRNGRAAWWSKPGS